MGASEYFPRDKVVSPKAVRSSVSGVESETEYSSTYWRAHALTFSVSSKGCASAKIALSWAE
jgi:hypothetical protein